MVEVEVQEEHALILMQQSARRLTSFSAVSTAGWLTSTGADYLE